MGALLDSESRRLAAEHRWSEIETTVSNLQRDDPAAWRNYLAELSHVAIPEPDADAAQEWPEHNA